MTQPLAGSVSEQLAGVILFIDNCASWLRRRCLHASPIKHPKVPPSETSAAARLVKGPVRHARHSDQPCQATKPLFETSAFNSSQRTLTEAPHLWVSTGDTSKTAAAGAMPAKRKALAGGFCMHSGEIPVNPGSSWNGCLFWKVNSGRTAPGK